MTPHRITKTFKGSQTGHDHDEFVAGSVRDLSRDLAAVVVKEGWAEPVATVVVSGVDNVEPFAQVALGQTAAQSDGEEITPDDTEAKNEEAAPENKMKKPVKGKK
jgi:hypothetical protein